MNARRILAAVVSTVALLAVNVGVAESAAAGTSWHVIGKDSTVQTAGTSWHVIGKDSKVNTSGTSWD